ncbi:MAG: right-handed parallel beta-helix repeat-containing protein, partial [Cytophagaceae bacterium]
MKRIILVSFIFCLLASGFASATVYTVDRTDGGSAGAGTVGSLRYCIDQAQGSAGPHTINFSIPGAAPFIINITGEYSLGNQAITIDATTQPGYVAGTPVVIIRGNTGIDGFNIYNNTITIRGLIFQSLRNAIILNGGTAHVISGCWFGLDQTGNTKAGVALNLCGVRFNNDDIQNVVIGNNTAAGRNVFSGCLNSNDGTKQGAIRLGQRNYGTVIEGNIIGLNASGTSAANVGNGSGFPLYQHGIYMPGNGSGTRVRIRNNVISNNTGNGIWIEGGYQGTVITGNMIGTDITGMLPLGNKAAGLRVDGNNSGGSHFIGVDESLSVGAGNANRNIISGNGGADDSRNCRAGAWGPAPCNSGYLAGCGGDGSGCPQRYDGTLQCGIYFLNVNNTVIANNFVGTDATGNATIFPTTLNPYNGLGNLYAGIKIEGNSNGNTIGGAAATGNVIAGNGFDPFVTSGSTTPYLGHGIQLNHNSVRTTTITYNFVGVGINGTSKIGNRQDGISILGSKNNTIRFNTIGNNAWGLFLQSDFNGTGQTNMPSGNNISDNFIGTTSAGLNMGNGIRTTAGGDPVTDADGGGIGVQHGSYSNTFSNNTIRFNRNGVNLRSSGNGGPPYQNTFSSNTITNNVNVGIRLAEGSGINTNVVAPAGANTLSGNTISSNGTFGIELSNAHHTRIYSNTIASNTSDGINIHSASTNNLIGGTAVQGNTISNNGGNGINITNPNAATTNNNAIHNNSFSCNALRGIELNGAGNDNYARPQIVDNGNGTFNVTGGNYIELYLRDNCYNCSTPEKVQGLTLVLAQNAPITNFTPAAGRTIADYTATTSSAAPGTGHNTSEFSQWVVPTPTPGSNSPICSGNTINLTASNVSSATYYWTGPSFTSTTQNPTRAAATVAMAGTYEVRAIIAGCTSTVAPVVVVVNETPGTPAPTSNSPVCTGGTISLNAGVVAGANSYNWTGPGGYTATGQTPNRTSATTAMAGSYTVIAVSAANCSSQPGSVTVAVNNTPPTPTTGSNTPVCTGNPINLTANSAGATSYSWTGPAGFTSTEQNPVRINSTTLMAGTYEVRAIAPGCTSAVAQTIVVVNTTPGNPNASSNTPVCTGATLQLNAASAGA